MFLFMIAIDRSECTKCTRQQSHPSLLAQDGELGTFLPCRGAESTEGEPTPATTFITLTCSPALRAIAVRQGSL